MWEWWKKNRSLLLGLVLILAALLGYSLGLRDGGRTGWFERVALRLGGPVFGPVADARYAVAGVWNAVVPGGGLDLEAETRRLRAEMANVEELKRENDRLKRLLDFVEQQPRRTLAARVIGEDATSWFRTIEIDRGFEDGVTEGLPVIDAAGLVGRVVKSAAHSARVLLITDASSAVAVLVQDERIRGVCRGQGGTLALDFALVQDAIQVGDGIITSGSGGVFPKGLVVGYVRSVRREEFGLFQTVEVESAVDFAHLEEVLVLLKEGP
ncbi:MAG: rod shape-determining protein MreC [Desulfuromonas sp.]|nr:rod shape-determining protein MreC [Desulfuromonas sp.]